jgi:hypothetical protein
MHASIQLNPRTKPVGDDTHEHSAEVFRRAPSATEERAAAAQAEEIASVPAQ